MANSTYENEYVIVSTEHYLYNYDIANVLDNDENTVIQVNTGVNGNNPCIITFQAKKQYKIKPIHITMHGRMLQGSTSPLYVKIYAYDEATMSDTLIFSQQNITYYRSVSTAYYYKVEADIDIPITTNLVKLEIATGSTAGRSLSIIIDTFKLDYNLIGTASERIQAKVLETINNNVLFQNISSAEIIED